MSTVFTARKTIFLLLLSSSFLTYPVQGVSENIDKYVYRFRLGTSQKPGDGVSFVIPDANGVMPSRIAISAQTAFKVEAPSELSASEYAVLFTPSMDLVGVLPTTILPGEQYKVGVISPESYKGRKTVSLSAGGLKGKWSIAAQDADVTPDPFTLSVHPFLPNARFESENFVTPTGYEAETELFISSDLANASNGRPVELDDEVAAISVNGGPWSSRGLIKPGDSLRARAYGGDHSAAKIYYIGVVGENGGGLVGHAVFTSAPPTTKASLPDVVYTRGAKAGSTVVSDAIAPHGFNTSASITVQPDPLSKAQGAVSVGGGPWGATGAIEPGQSFKLRYDIPEDAFDGEQVQLGVIYAVGTSGGHLWSIAKNP